MERFFVTGAAQHERYTRRTIKELSEQDRLEEVYSKAVLLEIDFAGKSILRRLEIPREEMPVVVPGYATNFTAAVRHGDTLWLPFTGGILETSISDFKIQRCITHPLFNDLHHVTFREGLCWGATTGLDGALSFDPAVRVAPSKLPNDWNSAKLDSIDIVSPRKVEFHPALPDLKFDQSQEYRFTNTKPHQSHPNYVFFKDGEPWITRAKQHDCAPLANLDKAIALADVMVHDGEICQADRGARAFLTSVKGQVIEVDLEAAKIIQTFDLIEGRWHLLTGWCRGLHVTDDAFYVGFSVFRRTKQLENIAWLKAKLTGKNPPMPTRIEKICRHTGKLLDQMTFNPLQLNAVFSILPATSRVIE